VGCLPAIPPCHTSASIVLPERVEARDVKPVP
jgi:hypothetical protein